MTSAGLLSWIDNILVLLFVSSFVSYPLNKLPDVAIIGFEDFLSADNRHESLV